MSIFHRYLFNKNENDNIPVKGPSLYTAMENFEITTKGVLVLLARMDPHKATGPDKISAMILKTLAEEVAPILRLLFQASLSQGIVPSEWRQAHVVPIFKKGDRNKAANYRPVSLTSICCKHLEHIIRSNVMDHLDAQKILTNSQHSFRKKRSTVSQLIHTIHDFTKTRQFSSKMPIIFLAIYHREAVSCL